jgi:hypothetical protein
MSAILSSRSPATWPPRTVSSAAALISAVDRLLRLLNAHLLEDQLAVARGRTAELVHACEHAHRRARQNRDRFSALEQANEDDSRRGRAHLAQLRRVGIDPDSTLGTERS